MASIEFKKLCVACNKSVGLFKCQGCKQIYCTNHVIEHRQALNYKLNEIICEHDSLQEKIIKSKDESSSLINHVYEWEQTSIMKIQEMARECRKKLMELEDPRKKILLKQLNLVSERIKKAHKDDDFFESDLNNWMSALNKLKHELINSSLLSSVLEDLSAPLIYELKVFSTSFKLENQSTFDYCVTKSDEFTSQDLFERCLNGAKIEDNGRVVVHDAIDCPVEVRGKSNYFSGIHRFRLQIEQNPLNTWIFFGIISQSTTMAKNSFESPSAYGWADYADYFIDGIRQANHNGGYFQYTRVGDIIELIVDCYNRKISYMNERNQKNQQLDIDIDKCQFPWQFHMNFYGRDDRVRLISVINES